MNTLITMNTFHVKTISIIVLFWVPVLLSAQTSNKVPVITLGTFHFSFPNLDVKKIDKSDQIDVLESTYQKEIEEIVRGLSKFKPTIIVIERQPGEQFKTDSLYQEYLKGNYHLSRGEDEQIGFRLARANALKKLYCVDEWGNLNENVAKILDGKDSLLTQKFESFYYTNPDSLKKTKYNPTFKSIGIRKELLLMNDEKRIKESLGDYLVGIFKYEANQNDFLGVDFETGRWFSRNLKIFRNIQRIGASPGDRMVVIFGSGHLNLLNYFLECSPEYQLLDVKEFLR